MSISEEPRPHIKYSGLSKSSDAEALKRSFVAQMYLKRGDFFEAVRAMRTRWDIRVRSMLPEIPESGPPVVLFWPENKPKFVHISPIVDMKRFEARDRAETHNLWVREYEQAWIKEVRDIESSVVPRELQTEHGLWQRLISACVLYSSPEADLEAFANCFPLTAWRIATEREGGARKDVLVQTLPIRMLTDREDVENRLLEYFGKVLDAINKRYLHPINLDAHEMRKAVESDPDTNLFADHWNFESLLRKRPYIEVTERTTDEEVTNSQKAIKAKLRAERNLVPMYADDQWINETLSERTRLQQRNKPARDPLTALQSAILMDRLNAVDPKDKRKRRWTYKTIAEHLNLNSPRAAKDYVNLGRNILTGKVGVH